MSFIIQGRGESILNLDIRRKEDLVNLTADHLFLVYASLPPLSGSQRSFVKQRREDGAASKLVEPPTCREHFADSES